MKKTLFALFAILFALNISGQEINWMSMNEALEAQKDEPKKIFMDAYTTWCGPCKMLDKRTFADEDVAAYINEHYYAVKFNAEGNEEIDFMGTIFTNPGYVPNKKGRNSRHTFASALQINGYPSMVFFDENGKVIMPLVGYRSAKELELYLKMFAKDHHKKLTSTEDWKEYQKNFEPSF